MVSSADCSMTKVQLFFTGYNLAISFFWKQQLTYSFLDKVKIGKLVIILEYKVVESFKKC